jgi:replication initiation and membrane attachment protein
LDLEPGERGRKFFVEQTSKLEATGLLETYRKFVPEMDDYVYEYVLYAPLSPSEFFKNQHLTLLLRDKVGKHAVLALKDELLLSAGEYGDAPTENLSVPFYELFRLNTQAIDLELEQSLAEAAAGIEASRQVHSINAKGFRYADIIMRFPKESLNRAYVERLKHDQDQLAKINFIAKKYALTLGETCRLLDEDGAFDETGSVDVDFLQQRANLIYRQDKKRSEDRDRYLARLEGAETKEPKATKAVEMEYYLEVPDIFQGECNQHQYNYILRNEPYTYLLEKIFSKGTVPDGLLDIFAKIDLNYGLSEEVINVMIHYIYVNKRSWSKSSIESTAADMLGKQIQTFEQAVQYVRDAEKYKERLRGGKTGNRSSASASGKGRVNQKPVIPIVQNRGEVRELTKEEREEMNKIIQKLGGSLKL